MRPQPFPRSDEGRPAEAAPSARDPQAIENWLSQLRRISPSQGEGPAPSAPATGPRPSAPGAPAPRLPQRAPQDGNVPPERSSPQPPSAGTPGDPANPDPRRESRGPDTQGGRHASDNGRSISVDELIARQRRR
ncbi:hypothetical protein [Rhodococcus chondri]|uniref:Uncharacterized protein n=1 Tax=Rhodococcus chondri TaxID=3065941 RepID=A0ABU7JP40_9NOCA|nr:hypothetical protein [Rhodococcus sp. CC-R104]MEE2031802.1 hypothetical protein [Rhodococcus sp. CC-R104]